MFDFLTCSTLKVYICTNNVSEWILDVSMSFLVFEQLIIFFLFKFDFSSYLYLYVLSLVSILKNMSNNLFL
jgi:hypothetical protein